MTTKNQKTKKECEINSENVIKSLKIIFDALTSRYILITRPKHDNIKVSVILVILALIIAPWIMIPVILIGAIVGVALGYTFIIEKKTK